LTNDIENYTAVCNKRFTIGTNCIANANRKQFNRSIILNI